MKTNADLQKTITNMHSNFILDLSSDIIRDRYLPRVLKTKPSTRREPAVPA